MVLYFFILFISVIFCKGQEITNSNVCPTCNLDNEEVQILRLERIKNDILRKLGLSGPPNITIPYSVIPEPLKGDTLLNQHHYQPQITTATQKIVILPTNSRLKLSPSLRIRVEIVLFLFAVACSL